MKPLITNSNNMICYKSKIDGRVFPSIVKCASEIYSYFVNEHPEIQLPTKWEMFQHYKSTNHYWFEQYFEEINLENPPAMARRRALPLDEVEVCYVYQNHVVSVDSMAFMFFTSKKRIREILEKHNIKRRTAGGQIKHTDKYEYTKEKYQPTNTTTYVAICKTTGDCIADYNNKSGALRMYVEDKLGIQLPSRYKLEQQFKETGNYWYEEYFDIVEVSKNRQQRKKCPYCDWSTADVNNLGGWYYHHIKDVHGLSFEEHLKIHPEDEPFFHKQLIQKEKKKSLENPDNYVTCPICGIRMNILTYNHLKTHGLTVDEFNLQYPNFMRFSKKIYDETIARLNKLRLEMPRQTHTSKGEIAISEYLKSIGGFTISDRSILNGQELDMYLPYQNLAIEYDGLLWHSEWYGNKTPDYHLNKTERCEEKGIHLIHIFENELQGNDVAVYNTLRRILGKIKYENDIDASTCVFEQISMTDAMKFVMLNSFKDYVQSEYNFALTKNGVQIAVISFNESDINKGTWTIENISIAHGYDVKNFLSYAIERFKVYHKAKIIIAYADRRWYYRKNNIFLDAGFKESQVFPPEVWYMKTSQHPTVLRSEKYATKYFIPESIPLPIRREEDIKLLTSNNIQRIYDCGKIEYILC